MSVVAVALLVVAFIAVIYLALPDKPERRRRVARWVMLLSASGVLLTEAYDRTGWSRWANLAIGLFGIATVVRQIVKERLPETPDAR